MNGRKRTIQVKFYVTEEERKLIEEKMKLVPTSNMAAYLRKIAIDGYIIQVDHTDIKAMTQSHYFLRGQLRRSSQVCFQQADVLRHTEHERQAVPGQRAFCGRPRQGKQGKELCGIPSGENRDKLERQAENRRGRAHSPSFQL